MQRIISRATKAYFDVKLYKKIKNTANDSNFI